MGKQKWNAEAGGRGSGGSIILWLPPLPASSSGLQKRVNFLKRNAKYTAPSKEMIFLLLPSLPPTEAEAEGELPAAAGGDRPQSSNIISASGFSGNETRSLSLACFPCTQMDSRFVLPPPPPPLRKTHREEDKFFPGFSPFLFPL